MSAWRSGSDFTVASGQWVYFLVDSTCLQRTHARSGQGCRNQETHPPWRRTAPAYRIASHATEAHFHGLVIRWERFRDADTARGNEGRTWRYTWRSAHGEP